MYCGFVCKYKKNLACEILRLRRVAICDMFLIRRSAILTECFLCNGNEVSYYIKNRLKLLLETVIKSYYRGTTHLDHPVHSLMYYHTRLIDNGVGSRCLLLLIHGSVCFMDVVQVTLESPFSKMIHTAIPPPAALCNINRLLTTLSQRFFFMVLL